MMEKASVPKRLTKHSIEHLTSPGSDCENGSDGSGPASPKKHKENSEKIVSYTEMIAKAIFASPNNMSTLAEIYNYLIVKYPILSSRGKSWKNSVRHTLSLNEWFVKIPKLDNAKCCYWSIHPVYVQRFRRGDFQKQRKASVAKICSHQNQRYYDLGYDISPTPDYHFMPPAHYQPEISSGISPHGSFSPWPMHRQYEEMQPNFFPTASHYSPFPMYNIPPPPFPSMYTHDQPADHQQYTNIPPTIKPETHSNDADKYMHGEAQENYRSEQRYNEYYATKHENNNHHQQQQQPKHIDLVNNLLNAASNQDNNITQSQPPHVNSTLNQSHVNSALNQSHVSSTLNHSQVSNTLNLLSNAALSAQHAMNLSNAVSQNRIINNPEITVVQQTFNDTVKEMQPTPDTQDPSNNQQLPHTHDSTIMQPNSSSSIAPSIIQNALLHTQNPSIPTITSLPSDASTDTQAFPQSFPLLPQHHSPSVNNSQANNPSNNKMEPQISQASTDEALVKIEIKSEEENKQPVNCETNHLLATN